MPRRPSRPAEPPTGISGATPTERCPGALNNLKAELSLDTSLAFGGSGPIPKAGKKDIVSIPLVGRPVGPAL